MSSKLVIPIKRLFCPSSKELKGFRGFWTGESWMYECVRGGDFRSVPIR